MTTRFVVTLTNGNTACGYAGLPKRTMPQAFRSAVERASDEFLTHGVDHFGTWQILFESARNEQTQFKSYAAVGRDDALRIQVQITRQQVGF